MQPSPPCSAPASLFSRHLLVVDVSIWATSPLGVEVRHVICGFYLFIFSSRLCCPLKSKTLHRPASERVSWHLETFLLRLPSQDRSLSLTLLSLFYLLYFVLPPFEDNGLPFWVSGVLHQCSEVVLWYLLSVQMIIQ